MPRFLALLALAVALPFAANAGQPNVTIMDDRVVVSDGTQSLTIALADARLNFRGNGQDLSLHVNLQQADGWTPPQPATEKPHTVKGTGFLQVSIKYPVSEQREFYLGASAHATVPGLYVTSRLRVLDQTRGQYYYWQSDLTADHYFAPGQSGPTRTKFKLDAWDGLPWRQWWFIPRGATGLAILPTNDGGRPPGPAGCLFLHALPRSNTISPGDTLDASFGLAAVADAKAAAAVAQKAYAAGLGALAPWSMAEQKWDYGKPAPQWLRDAEIYNLYYRNAAQWTDENVNNKLKGHPFIIGSTPDVAALERCHKAGVRLLHYVVYTCLLDTEMQVREGGRVYSEWTESVDNENRDLAKHPDWVCITAAGTIQKDAWGQEHGHKGLLNTCLHQRGLQDAAVRQVRILMERGYDGVFIDLAGPVPECYGPKYGKHTHPQNRTNTQAYQELLQRLYDEVKRHGNDRVVIQNTCTALLPSQWVSCDSQMLEAFPYGAGSTNLRATVPELRWQRLRHAEAIRRGKVPVLLAYFGGEDKEQIKRAALLSHAYARAAGFLWADGLGLLDIPGLEDLAKSLYATRTGPPTAPAQELDGVLTRKLTRGSVAANLNPWPVTQPIDLPPQTGRFIPK